MVRPALAPLRFLGLVALGLVLAHQAVYLARYGSIYGEALVHSGHGQAWSDAVTIVVAGAAVLLAIALIRLHRLGLVAADVASRRPASSAAGPTSSVVCDAGAAGVATGRSLAIAWLRSLALVVPAVLVALTVQENLEHVAIGLAAPGPFILVAPEYPMAVPITVLVATAVAFVAALLSWRREVLTARLRAAQRPRPSIRVAPRNPSPAIAIVRGSILARRLGRRAPPLPLAS